MNTKSRAQKIDEFLEDAKRFFIVTLLVAWGVLTVFLGIGFMGNRLEVKNLKSQIEKMEEQKRVEATTYVVVDGHKYEVIDTTY